MRPSLAPSLRPIRSGLVPVLLMAFLVPLVGGCSSDADPADAAVTATAPADTPSDTPADTPADTPSDSANSDETRTDTANGGPTGTPTDRAVAAVCAPYLAMVSAVKDAASRSEDADEVAAEIGPVLKEFAAEVPALDRPDGLPEETWRGVVALAEQIARLPERPTDAEIEAVEGQLSPEEQAALADASSWFQTNCA